MVSTYAKGVLTPLPGGLATKDIETNGATIHIRVGSGLDRNAHRHRAGPARSWSLLQAGGWL